MNIVDAIEQHASSRPQAIALVRKDWRATYAETHAATRRIAALLASRGVSARDPVAVSIAGNSALLVLCVLALASLGAISLTILPGVTRHRRQSLAAHFRLAYVVADRDDLGAGASRMILADESWLAPRAPESAPPARHPGGEQTWCINLTSGTTGAPKGVVRTHADFLAFCDAQRTAAGVKSDSRHLCLMDLHNPAAAHRALGHLVAGGTVFLADAGLREALRSRAIDRDRITHTFASPRMMQKWLQVIPATRPPCESLVHLSVGGGRVSAELGREIVERITPNLFLNYGTTETGIVAQADPRTRAEYPNATGRILPGVEAQIVDDRDRPLPSGRHGVLRLRGRGVASGYCPAAPEPEAPAKGFRDGWFYPGDTGRINDDGVLYIEDRVDDVINLGGHKVNAARMEAILSGHPSVIEAAVVGVSAPGRETSLVAVVVAREPFDKKRLARHYETHGGQFSRLMKIVRLPKLPRNAMGKILRQELRRRIKFKPRASSTP